MKRSYLFSSLALAAALAACAPAPLLYPPDALTTSAHLVTQLPADGKALLGKAWLDAPLVDATVALYDGSGKLVQELANATNVNGIFALPLTAELPKPFKLKVSGGTKGGVANTDTLTASYDGFDPVGSVAFVNALTTLVDRVQAAKPGSSTADAAVAVRSYAGLPEDCDFGYEIGTGAEGLFDQGKFMATAKAEGGFEAFVTQQAADASQGKTRSFAGEPAKGIFEDAATGLLKEVGKEALGYALSELGYKDPATRRHEEVLARLNEQKEMLRQQSLQLQQIDNKLTSLSKEVADAKRDIVKAVTESTYEVQSTALAPTRGRLDDLYNCLQAYIEAGPDPDLYAKSTAFRARVKNEAGAALSTIHSAMVSGGGARGMIGTWADVNLKRLPDNSLVKVVDNRYLSPVNSVYDYYAGYQLKALLLLLEVYHSDPSPDKALIAGYLKAYPQNLEAQAKLRGYKTLSPALANEVMVDSANNLMWTKKPAKIFYDKNTKSADFTTFNATTGVWSGPNMMVGYGGMAYSSNPGPDLPPALAKLSGWRTPSAEEVSIMGTGTKYQSSLPHNILRNSGFAISTDTDYLMTAASINQGGKPTNYIMLFSGGGLLPAASTRRVQVLLCRPLENLDETAK